MKKIILLALLCIGFIGARAAAVVNVTNNTPCPITITVFDYVPDGCIITIMGAPVVVNPGATISIPVPPPSAAFGVNAYYTGCPTPSVNTAFGSACFPAGSILPPCPPCVNRTITWLSPTKVVIN